jgi:hypothetical protein
LEARHLFDELLMAPVDIPVSYDMLHVIRESASDGLRSKAGRARFRERSIIVERSRCARGPLDRS